MSKKKRFGISDALTRGLSETINVVENNSGVYRNVILPLSRIELDPDNPRRLAIDLMDVQYGIKQDDPQYQLKQEELDRLKELAITIKSSGVINPVVAYKRGELYRIVAGERRCLASILAGKKEIEARIFSERPKAFELKLVQWIENTAREDLTLSERLDNARDLIHEYQQQGEGVEIKEMSATVLKNITGLSLSQSTYYLAVLNASPALQSQIKNGNIRNLDKAALLAGITSSAIQDIAIEACINGASLKELRTMVVKQKSLTKTKITSSTRGRTTARINMGSTTHVLVIKTMVEAILTQDPFAKYSGFFSQINWDDLRQTTKAFRKIIEILEASTVA